MGYAMSTKPVKVLLIEDNSVQRIMMQAMLAKAGASQPFLHDLELVCADQLSTGLAQLDAGGIDVVLLDLSLPDADGLTTLVKVREQEPDIPIVVLTGHDDEQLAVEAMKSGAQDYLVKGQIDNQILVRALRYAIERHRLLRSLSLTDDLTGLYNRRGFIMLAEQHIKLAQRTESDFLLFFADMDGLKQINDALGHKEGAMALVRTAELLKSTFRESDIMARIGGDEFTILATNAVDDSGEDIIARLQENLDAYNARSSAPYKLSISVGVARYDFKSKASLEDVMARADQAMYEQKRSKHRHVLISV